MNDDQAEVPGAVLELRAWEIRGAERALVAERVRFANGKCEVIWHVPEIQIRGILWLELLDQHEA